MKDTVAVTGGAVISHDEAVRRRNLVLAEGERLPRCGVPGVGAAQVRDSVEEVLGHCVDACGRCALETVEERQKWTNFFELVGRKEYPTAVSLTL